MKASNEVVITIREAGNEIVHRLDRRRGGRVTVAVGPDGIHLSSEGAAFSQDRSEERSEPSLEELFGNKVPSCYTGSGKLYEYYSRHRQKPDEPSCPDEDCRRRWERHSDKL